VARVLSAHVMVAAGDAVPLGTRVVSTDPAQPGMTGSNCRTSPAGTWSAAALKLTRSVRLTVHMVTVSGQTFQISSQYSAMARSDENLPLRAVFRMDIFVHDSLSCQAALTWSWQFT
jgi:hypothetical protein